MTTNDEIIIISDTVEVHPTIALRWAVVRNGQVYGEYEDREYALELARELAGEAR